MNRLLNSLLLPALMLSAAIAPAQEGGAPGPNPADYIAKLYPPKALESLKKQAEEDLCPYGILSTGKAAIVLSSLGATKGGSQQDLVLSTSKDGKSWEKLIIAVSDFAPCSSQANVAAVYDSILRQIVLFAYVTPYASPGKPARKTGALSSSHFYVATGKGGKFTRPRNISKQFLGQKGSENFEIQEHGLFFQGICLTKGPHKGRLLFLSCPRDKEVCSIYSDDHGRSWKRGESITVRSVSTCLGDGLTLCEAEDGTVVSYTGGLRSGGTWLSSADGGTTWEPQKGALSTERADPAHWPNAYMVLNTADGQGTNSRLLAISLVNNHHEHRFHVALSYDWGRTWPHEKTILSSALTPQPNLNLVKIAPGKLGIITSRHGGFTPTDCKEDAGFVTFTLSWLTDGKDSGVDEEEKE